MKTLTKYRRKKKERKEREGEVEGEGRREVAASWARELELRGKDERVGQ
jgi:hypothetical protein